MEDGGLFEERGREQGAGTRGRTCLPGTGSVCRRKFRDFSQERLPRGVSCEAGRAGREGTEEGCLRVSLGAQGNWVRRQGWDEGQRKGGRKPAKQASLGRAGEGGPSQFGPMVFPALVTVEADPKKLVERR